MNHRGTEIIERLWRLRIDLSKVILLLLYLIPVFATIGFIAAFAVDVPAYDQWVLPGLFEKVATNNLTFADLFELHNYHRILFPRLIYIGLGFLSSWNILAEISFSFILASITYIFLYKLSIITSKSHNNLLFHLSNLMTGLLIFSLTQRWLWGFQLPIFLINLFLVIGCLILSLPRLSTPFKLFLTALCCIITSFSSAQGLMVWLAVLPGIVSLVGNRFDQIKRVSLWLFLFFVSCGIYLIGYYQDPRNIELSLIERLLISIQFFFNLLAAPLLSAPKVTVILGMIIFANFIYLCFYFTKEQYLKYKTFGSASPWLSIGIFAVITALLMSAGRVEQGADYPIYAIRYTTHTILLLIAVIQLWRVWIDQKQDFIKTYHYSSLFYSFFAGILVCLIWVRSGDMIVETQLGYVDQKNGQTCLYLINYLEDSPFFKNSPERCVLSMSKTTWWIRDGVDFLQQIPLRNFAENLTFQTNTAEVYGYIDIPQNQDNIIQLNPHDTLTVSGWVILPDAETQPKLVFLSLDNNRSFFANAKVNLASPDIMEMYKTTQYQQQRWNVILSTDSLPTQLTEIKAWVYHPLSKQLLQLQGKIQVSVKPAQN
ncbi:MAG: hypothetical protein WBA13_17020 [Microcoleaceae cyanobacterium]